MNPLASTAETLWPLGLWLAVIVLMMLATLGLSAVLGPRHRARRRDLPYESGMPPTRQPPARFPIHFYLIALAFLVFDLEAAFLFAWATAARDVGWLGYIEALVFVVVLLVGLVYLWAKGAFDWGRRPHPGGGAGDLVGRAGDPAGGERNGDGR